MAIRYMKKYYLAGTNIKLRRGTPTVCILFYFGKRTLDKTYTPGRLLSVLYHIDIALLSISLNISSYLPFLPT